MTLNSISPATLYERISAGEAVDLVDVRSPHEYQSMRAAGARLVPLRTLTKENVLVDRTPGIDKPVYVICWSGTRSRAACSRLMEQGLANVINVEGGTKAWRDAGLPVEGSHAGRRTDWLRVGGLLGVGVSVVLGMTVSTAFLYAAAGLWVVMILTGKAPCCSSGGCSTDGGK